MFYVVIFRVVDKIFLNLNLFIEEIVNFMFQLVSIFLNNLILKIEYFIYRIKIQVLI